MILRHLNNSLNDNTHAASYNSGGKKIMNIISGFSSIVGNPGIKLMSSPASTNNTG